MVIHIRPHNRSGDVVMKYIAILQIVIGIIILYGTIQDGRSVHVVIYGLGAWIIVFVLCNANES